MNRLQLEVAAVRRSANARDHCAGAMPTASERDVALVGRLRLAAPPLLMKIRRARVDVAASGPALETCEATAGESGRRLARRAPVVRDLLIVEVPYAGDQGMVAERLGVVDRLPLRLEMLAMVGPVAELDDEVAVG